MPEKLNEKSLPSKKEFYDAFNDATDYKCCPGKDKPQEQDQLKSELNGYTGLDNQEGPITKAYCYACKDNGCLSSTGAHCTFFYFWVGNIFFRNSDSKEFSEFMGKIYSALENIFYGYKCSVNYQKVNKLVFGLMKKLYDFQYDYGTIKEQVQICKESCDETYSAYLNKVDAAYNVLNGLCTLYYNDNKWCKEFWAEYRMLLQQKLSELQSILNPKEEATEDDDMSPFCLNAQLAASRIDEAVRQATTTTAFSSIIGTLAATVFPFVLYKYKPWSSWFGNNSSGGRSNRRGRRSTGQNFDASTEDNLTEYSTDTSTTIGPTEHSTVRSSAAAYARQLTRRREGKAGANYSTPGHRNNVGYRRM